MWTNKLEEQLYSSLELIKRNDLSEDVEEELIEGIKLIISGLARSRAMKQIKIEKINDLNKSELKIAGLKKQIALMTKESRSKLVIEKNEAVKQYKEQRRQTEYLIDENSKLVRKIDHYIEREVRIIEILKSYDVDFIIGDLLK